LATRAGRKFAAARGEFGAGMNGKGGSNTPFAIYFMRTGTNVPQEACA
jgi:hypothetical protein